MSLILPHFLEEIYGKTLKNKQQWLQYIKELGKNFFKLNQRANDLSQILGKTHSNVFPSLRKAYHSINAERSEISFDSK